MKLRNLFLFCAGLFVVPAAAALIAGCLSGTTNPVEKLTVVRDTVRVGNCEPCQPSRVDTVVVKITNTVVVRDTIYVKVPSSVGCERYPKGSDCRRKCEKYLEKAFRCDPRKGLGLPATP